MKDSVKMKILFLFHSGETIKLKLMYLAFQIPCTNLGLKAMKTTVSSNDKIPVTTI